MKSAPNLVIGNFNIDMVFYPVNVLPAWGEERTCDVRLVRAAGSAGYAALTLGRLGVPAEAVGNVGSDVYGPFILEALRAVGVGTDYLQRTQAPTALSVTMTNQQGDRAFVTHYGHLDHLDVRRVLRDIQALPQTGYCLLAGYFLLRHLGPHGAMDILKCCRARGGTTMLDTGFDPQGWAPDTVESLRGILQAVDVFFPNAQEATAISGEPDAERAAWALLDMGPEMVFIKRGALGSCFASHEMGLLSEPAIPVEAFDTTGAGDAFNAGVIFGLSRGWEPNHILRFANGVGAITVSRREDRAPSPDEVCRLLQECGLDQDRRTGSGWE